MVRHAESPFVFGAERTRELSEEGKLAAKQVATHLLDKNIDVIVSSSYTRAIQTVQHLASHQGLTISEYDELRERPIKGLDYKLPSNEITEAIKQSFEDKEYCLPGGESTLQAQNRSIPIIKQLLQQYKGKHIVIGTHGNIMTIIMNYFNSQYGYDFWNSTSKPDIYELVFDQEELINVQRLWK
jgi:2,3-bisphosphoglycerate-dependent phosphoglycerate mutase